MYLGQILSGEEAVSHLSKGLEVMNVKMEEVRRIAAPEWQEASTMMHRSPAIRAGAGFCCCCDLGVGVVWQRVDEASGESERWDGKGRCPRSQ